VLRLWAAGSDIGRWRIALDGGGLTFRLFPICLFTAEGEFVILVTDGPSAGTLVPIFDLVD
jgi:hypothetical protein